MFITKLVCYRDRLYIPGQHGLALIPDCTLEQALYKANRIRCIIIPAPWAALQQFSYDPRLAELLRLAMRNQALIVVSALPQPTNPQTYNTFLPGLETQLDNIVTYPDVEELLMFTGDALLLWLQRE